MKNVINFVKNLNKMCILFTDGGVSIELCFDIIRTEVYDDGIKIYGSGGENIWLSSVTNTLLESNDTEYVLKSINGCLIIIDKNI